MPIQDVSFWTSPKGILLEISIIVIIILAINAIYLLFRLRTLTITVTLLQKHITSANAQLSPTREIATPAIFQYIKELSSPLDNSTSTFAQLFQEQWKYYITSLLVITIAYSFIKLIIDEMCHRYSFTNCSKLSLHCTKNHTAVNIELMILNGRPSDYQFFASSFLENIKITQNLFDPILMFDSENFHLIHTFSKQFIKPPTEMHLTYFPAYLLRDMFPDNETTIPAQACPLTIYQNRIFAILLKPLHPDPSSCQDSTSHLPSNPASNPQFYSDLPIIIITTP